MTEKTEVWLLISAGDGPRECEWVVYHLSCALSKEAESFGLKWRVVEGEDKPEKSRLIQIKGDGASTFARNVTGSVKWIGESPYRPHHKRKNWFVGVYELPMPEAVPELDTRDIKLQTMKASGPGGQHVNKTDSAVRATHMPTGLQVVSQAERSQHANKRLAILKLALKLAEQAELQTEAGKEAAWRKHHILERGNEVRTYVGIRFKAKGH
ncbi:peptide chain release factor H [Kordiimonas sp. SCSIO 12610]|uniref:peptide chain release factor H n=1 Tax=Kordiimonas sp. SCSIO 12610 TaxID=2829597 RepID=UPI00210DD47A|nr:peptide chain release factor H [Kordiimonas sp. SCSIO 12610]UTW56311.1 peptide chain release factor H [Kordiimonas sp. SCSIO 12610]